MRPIVLQLTGTGTSRVATLDHYVSPFNVALSVRVSGTVNYTVQYTFDDVHAANYDPATGNWVPHPTLAGATTTSDSNIAYPVRGVRLVVNSGSGTAILTILQAGGGRTS